MIKVCHITSAHPRDDVRIFHKECESLSNAGYEVYLVERGESCNSNGIHIIGIGSVATNRARRMIIGTLKAYKKAVDIDADIYHIHDPELLPYALKLKRRGKIVIFDSHEHTAESILEKTYLPRVVRYPIYKIYELYQTAVCRKLDCIISVTPHIVDYFVDRRCRCICISNYPKLHHTSVATRINQTRQIVFAGGISPQWNHANIIKAIENISDCRYCLCGPASSDYLDMLKSLNNWKAVDYLGIVPHDMVPQLLAKSQIGVALLTPGRNTGFKLGTMGNTKIFEEMYAGLPVICTDFTLWKDFIDRYNCGICVNPADVDAISEAIQYLLTHTEKAIEMGENGKLAVEKEFNWNIEGEKLIDLYADLCEKAYINM